MSTDNNDSIPQDQVTPTPDVPQTSPTAPAIQEGDFFEAEDSATQPEPVVDTAPVEQEAIVPTQSKQHVEITASPYMPHTDKSKNLSNPVAAVFPSDLRDQLNAAVEETSNNDFTASAEGRKWASILMDSMQFCPADDVAQKALERPGSFWRQSVTHSGGELMGGYSKYRTHNGGAGQIVSGDAAVIRMQQHLRLGSNYRIPLWNSGFWVTFRAPDEPALMELERSLTNDKIELGRQSYGLTYSNTTAIFIDRVVNFAIEQIYNTSVKVPNGFDYRNIISNHDIPALLLGLAAAIWPDGFHHSRVCIANPDKCNHTIDELIHIPKTLVEDNSALSSWQINHMAKNSNSVMTLEEVKRYTDEMVVAQDREVVLLKDTPKEVTLKMRVPNVNEYVTAGNQWINSMVQMVDTALGKEVSNERRNQYIISHGKATSLRQYGQWIKYIRFGDLHTPEGDQETIDGLINTLSGDDEIRVAFMAQIAEFIASSTVTVVGVPSFTCPNCNGVNRSTRGHPTITEVIPYDPLQVFFVLIAQRVQRISER